MWTNKINNVVLENKNAKTFYEKSLWSHYDLNVKIQFLQCCSWGSIELKSEQYEAIEEMSSDAHTYDTQYNTDSSYNIVEFEKLLFVDNRNFAGTEFCIASDTSGTFPITNDDTLSAMSDLSWFQKNYGIGDENISKFYNILLEKGWVFIRNTYSIVGDILIMGKSDYDYLWITDDCVDGQDNNSGKHAYDQRISFLNNQT